VIVRFSARTGCYQVTPFKRARVIFSGLFLGKQGSISRSPRPAQ
jgi:hypothetical protein